MKQTKKTKKTISKKVEKKNIAITNTEGTTKKVDALSDSKITNTQSESLTLNIESKPKFRVLFAAFEATPFCKTGGLGDVAGSLPIYLKQSGVDIRVIMPLFANISEEYKKDFKFVCYFNVPLAWRNVYCGIFEYVHNGVTFYFIDNEYYFKRSYPYGFFDDGERIAFYSKALIESLLHLDFEPNIIHLNDWHTAMSAVFLREMYMSVDKLRFTKTIFTIHNIKFQGMYSKYVLGDILGLGNNQTATSQLMQGDAVNYMRGALNYADRITTVSPTYANEICSDFYGEGLCDVLNRRRSILCGIINGIDYDKFNPYKDKDLFYNLDSSKKVTAEDLRKFKIENKTNLQKCLGLEINPNTCLIGIVSRLTSQKGLDLVKYILGELLNYNLQFVVLGVGEKQYEDVFNYYKNIYPSKMSSNIYFSEQLSKQIYASCDALLVPSLFEPCGLSQMIAMRYGTLPIVRSTGGLKDSVIPYNKFTCEGNGFAFNNYNAHELLFTIQNMLDVYYNYRNNFDNLSLQAFNSNFSWEESSKKYIELYSELV